MDDSHVEALITELGPLDDSVAEIIRDPDGNWVVRVGDIDVVVEFDAAAQVLRIGTDIGIVPEASRLSVYESLLVYNIAAQSSGGVVMALTGPGGSVVQMLVLPVAGLTAQALVVPIVNLAERTPIWREIIANDDSDAPFAASPEFNSFIRV